MFEKKSLVCLVCLVIQYLIAQTKGIHMLVISSGMQKSGSAYFYNIINELLAASGSGIDARVIKDNKNLQDLMKWHNNNVGRLTLAKLIKLWTISVKDGTFSVKTHVGPNLAVKTLNTLGFVRIVYCYRDPRDVLLSAVDHGKKILNKGDNHTFANMVDFDIALEHVSDWLSIWEMYTNMRGVLTIKYEEMMQNPVIVTKRIEEFLNIAIDSEKRQGILWKFSKDNSEGSRRGMHFNKALAFRYKVEMTEEQQALCNGQFGDYLKAMGYEVA